MCHIKGILLIVGVLIAVVAVAMLTKSYFHKESGPFTVASSVFQNNGIIPDRYTCAADNVSPPLKFENVPSKAEGLVVIMHDLDAPGGDFTHWLVWGIPPKTKGFNEGTVVTEATQGTTDFGIASYGGPCPPSGTHRYVIDAYALDTALSLPKSTHRADLESALQHHVIAKSSLIATVTAKK